MIGADSGIGLYLRYLGVSIRGQLQYRASFAMTVLGQFITSGVEVVGLWALFDRFGQLAVWTLPQVALFYGVVHVAFAFADAFGRGFDNFGMYMVKQGDFDRMLLRPRATVLQIGGAEFALYRAGRLAQGLLVLGWAVWMLEIDWSMWRVLLLVFAISAAALMFTALIIMQATLAFWTTESLEAMNTVTYGGVETAQYPLAIYERRFRAFFTYVVPLGCVTYFPVVAVLGVDDPLGSSFGFQVSAPLAGIVFFLAGLVLWRIGVRHYTSTGS